MIYISSRLEGTVKDQLHPFIKNDFTFWFANADTMFTFLRSLYDDPDRRRSARLHKLDADDRVANQRKHIRVGPTFYTFIAK